MDGHSTDSLMLMYTLYYAPGACSLAPHIALEEAGAEYALQRVDLGAGEHKQPEYLAVNPKGAVPALQTEEGVLTENPAVLGYIARRFSEAGLAPDPTAFAYWRLASFNNFLSSSLHPLMGRLLFNRDPNFPQAEKERLGGLVADKLKLIEHTLFQGPWALGERYSVADAYLAVFTRWAKAHEMIDPAAYPKLNAHLHVVQARPAVRRALEAEGLTVI